MPVTNFFLAQPATRTAARNPKINNLEVFIRFSRSLDSPFSQLNRKLTGRWPGQLLGIAHRTVVVKFSHSQRFSPRKLIPVNLKTTGDYLLLKRIKADLSQQELAVKSGVTVRKVKAWEHDQSIPTEADWQVLAKILNLETPIRPTP